MRVFKNKWFNKFAEKEGITDEELRETVNQLETGQAEADLGGGVYKVRLARPGEGKSGGYRIIVFFRKEERIFFVYGFPKSAKDNIDHGELKIFKLRSKDAFLLTDNQIGDRIKNGTLFEVLLEAGHEIQK